MAWVDLSGAFGYGTKLTSTQMQNLRDNLTGLANGDSGAPAIQEAAMSAESVDQDALKCSEQEQSASIAAAANNVFTLTGGQFCLRGRFKATLGSIPCDIKTFAGDPTSSYAGPYYQITNTHSITSDTFYVKHQYVTASGEINWFFLKINKVTDEILAMSIAPDHPCFGHKTGPDKMPHPFLDYDPSIHKILLANPENDLIKKIRKDYPESLLDGMIALCDMDDDAEWPNIKVTVDSGKKQKIPKLNYVKMKKLKLK